MNAADMKRYICTTFDGVDVTQNDGDVFLFYDPSHNLPAERQLLFATIVTGDHYDTVSALDRPGAYRLNIGLTKTTYSSLFGAAPKLRDEQGVLQTGVDYAATDTLMPHPFYASQHWVCISNPGEANWRIVADLLTEAHAFAARKYANQQARRESAVDG